MPVLNVGALSLALVAHLVERIPCKAESLPQRPGSDSSLGFMSPPSLSDDEHHTQRQHYANIVLFSVKRESRHNDRLIGTLTICRGNLAKL